MHQEALSVSVSAESLITGHIALVGHLVRETKGRLPAHVDRDDLTSAGLTALVQAAQAYEAERGVPFARYAATRVRGAILDELRAIDWASRSVRRRARDMEAVRNSLAASLGRMPSNVEVASMLGVSVAEVVANDDDLARAQVLSLESGPDTSVGDTLVSPEPQPEAQVEHLERLTYLRAAIEELPERLRVVVEDYFFAERPMAEIAGQLNVSESRISQLRAEALVLLRDAMNTHLDPELVRNHRRPGGCADRRREAYFAAVADRQAVNAIVRVPRQRGTEINATA